MPRCHALQACLRRTATSRPISEPLPQEEKAKRAARAAKFGLPQADALVYAPDPEELKKAERGAKFGTGYQPDGALMDMGEAVVGG
mgnify:CR=1 FL=1